MSESTKGIKANLLAKKCSFNYCKEANKLGKNFYSFMF